MLTGTDAIAPGVEKATTVVVLGDSIILCSHSEPGRKLTDIVQSDLAANGVPNPVVINSGKGCDTAKGAYTRLESDVFAHHPDIVAIALGLNDTVRSTPEEFRKWLEELVRAIQKETAAKIILVTSTPLVNERHDCGTQFKDKGGLDEYLDTKICSQMRDVAKNFDLPLCDLHDSFKAEFKKGPSLVDAIICPDGVHLTEEGDRMFARYLSPVILSVLGKRCVAKMK